MRPPGSLTPRNRLIIQQRAAGRTVQSIAAEHGLSPARVSVICRDHRLEVEIARLHDVIARMDRELEGAHGEVLRLTRELRTLVSRTLIRERRGLVDADAVDRSIAARMVGRPTREDLFTTG
jgi:hypothetical protein